MGDARRWLGMTGRTSWVWLVLCVSLLALAPGGSAGEGERKFPPYPEVWGYELPWGSAARPSAALGMYRMPNGDYMVLHKIGFDKPEPQRVRAGLLFFQGVRVRFTREESDNFDRTHPRVPNLLGQSVTLSDGTTLTPWTDCSGPCSRPFCWFIRKLGPTGQVLLEKNLVHLLDKPVQVAVGRNCESNWGLGKDDIPTRVRTTSPQLARLEDDSLLVFDFGGNLVIRLDRDLNSRSELVGKTVFLLDRSTTRAFERGRNDQEAADAGFAYIQTLIKGGAR